MKRRKTKILKRLYKRRARPVLSQK